MFQATSLIVRHRRTILVALAAAIATSLLIAGAVLGWRVYSDWQLGLIEVVTQGTPLLVQVLPAASDEPLGEPFDLVTRSKLSLPAGDYRLRVNAPGRLGQTYRLAINQGETETHTLSLDDTLLLGQGLGERFPNGERVPEQPMLFAPVTVTLELKPGVAEFIERTNHSLIRRDGVTGEVVWDAMRPAKPFPKERDPGRLVQVVLGKHV